MLFRHILNKKGIRYLTYAFDFAWIYKPPFDIRQNYCPIISGASDAAAVIKPVESAAVHLQVCMALARSPARASNCAVVICIPV